MKHVMLTFFSILLTMGGLHMAEAKSTSAKKDGATIIHYEGFADLGRIKMIVTSSGDVEISYEHHPMVISKEKPWKKKSKVKPAELDSVFAVLNKKYDWNTSCPELTLMPGQDVTLSTVLAFTKEGKQLINCSFLEAPKPLGPVLNKLKDIYTKVKRKA